MKSSILEFVKIYNEINKFNPKLAGEFSDHAVNLIISTINKNNVTSSGTEKLNIDDRIQEIVNDCIFLRSEVKKLLKLTNPPEFSGEKKLDKKPQSLTSEQYEKYTQDLKNILDGLGKHAKVSSSILKISGLQDRFRTLFNKNKDEKDIDSNKEIDRQFDFFRRAENVKNIIETFEKLGKEGKLEFSDVESAYNNLGKLANLGLSLIKQPLKEFKKLEYEPALKPTDSKDEIPVEFQEEPEEDRTTLRVPSKAPRPEPKSEVKELDTEMVKAGLDKSRVMLKHHLNEIKNSLSNNDNETTMKQIKNMFDDPDVKGFLSVASRRKLASIVKVIVKNRS